MRFAEADSAGGLLIQAYEPGRVVIGGRAYSEGLIVSPEQVIAGWGPAEASGLTPEHLAALIELAPQVIVLGTGASQVFPGPEVARAALALGIGVEFMDTGAACRTYNILMGEGRKVAAGLIMC